MRTALLLLALLLTGCGDPDGIGVTFSPVGVDEAVYQADIATNDPATHPARSIGLRNRTDHDLDVEIRHPGEPTRTRGLLARQSITIERECKAVLLVIKPRDPLDSDAPTGSMGYGPCP